MLRTEAAGKEAKNNFITERLETSTNFFEPIKHLKLKTLGDTSKRGKVTATQNKLVQYQQQGNIALHLLMKCQKEGINLDLKELMKYPLTPVPYIIGTADGFLAKTDKSKGIQRLIKDQEDSPLPNHDEALVIQDGN